MRVQAVLTSSDSSFPSQQYIHTQPDIVTYPTTDCDTSVGSPQLCKVNMCTLVREHENSVQVINLVSVLPQYVPLSLLHSLFQCSRDSLCDFHPKSEASLVCTLYNKQNYCDIKHLQ
jgi:hypothetical protein